MIFNHNSTDLWTLCDGDRPECLPDSPNRKGILDRTDCTVERSVETLGRPCGIGIPHDQNLHNMSKL